VTIVNGYCTVQDVRDHVEDTKAVIAETLIERAISAVSRGIDRHCGFPRRKFWLDATPTTHTYFVSDLYEVWVDDIGDISGLVVETISGGVTDTWTTDDYHLEPLNADASGGAYAWTKVVSHNGRAFPRDFYQSTLRIRTRHGWSETPDEVFSATLLKAASLIKRKDAPFGVAGFGDFGVVRLRAEDPDVGELLAPFRRYGAGSI
jgi:hypothetical protein